MVNVLRSAGIPARQVYVPRWSHCDDNHAWVEVWCDGTWYFTGACEPLPILNQGWFIHASSRAMMVHSRIFDAKVPEGGSYRERGYGNHAQRTETLRRSKRNYCLCARFFLCADKGRLCVFRGDQLFRICSYCRRNHGRAGPAQAEHRSWKPAHLCEKRRGCRWKEPWRRLDRCKE